MFRLVACACVTVLLGAVPQGAAESRLLDAVKSGNLQAIRVLIKQKADVNEPQPDGATALHWAVNAEDVKLTSLLLGAGARVDVANDYGVTPLTLAASGRSVAIVEALLAAGASPNTALPTGETVLMTASRTGLSGAVTALLARGADPNAKEHVMGQTALMWAISRNNRDIVDALIANGADIRAVSNGGFTPLLFAAREGRAEIVRQLLERGADVNETDMGGHSVLHIAVVRGHLDLARLLLTHGANPNADRCGYTALHWAAGTWESIHSYDYIFNEAAVKRVHEWAVLAGIADRDAKHDLIKALLAHGADINRPMRKKFPEYGQSLFKDRLVEGATAFYLASLVSDVPTMRLLLAHGADSSIPANDGNTPLIIAAGLARVERETRVPEERVLEAVSLLLALGADINASNKTGQAALHAATMAALDHVVRHLVENGANIDAKTRKGETALKLAQGFEDGALLVHRPSTVRVLEELGANDPSEPDSVPQLGAPVGERQSVAAPK